MEEDLTQYNLKHQKSLLGICLSNKEFDKFICEQNKGKELKVVDGKLIAIEHIPTEEELKQQQISTKLYRLEELTKDFAQIQAGLIIENIEERKLEFQTLLNEVRILQGKDPRQIKQEN